MVSNDDRNDGECVEVSERGAAIATKRSFSNPSRRGPSIHARRGAGGSDELQIDLMGLVAN